MFSITGDTHLTGLKGLAFSFEKSTFGSWIKRNGAVLTHTVLCGVHAGVVDVVFHGGWPCLWGLSHQGRVPFPSWLDEVWFGGFGEHFIVLFDFVLARLEGFWVWARRERVVLLNNDGGLWERQRVRVIGSTRPKTKLPATWGWVELEAMFLSE